MAKPFESCKDGSDFQELFSILNCDASKSKIS
jgi:hypothetical protein